MKHQTTSPCEATSAPPTMLPPANGLIDNAALELLASWRAEDVTKNAEDVRAAEKELTEFKRAMNENRIASGEPVLYPRATSLLS
jgi:hypothetical protein